MNFHLIWMRDLGVPSCGDAIDATRGGSMLHTGAWTTWASTY